MKNNTFAIIRVIEVNLPHPNVFVVMHAVSSMRIRWTPDVDEEPEQQMAPQLCALFISWKTQLSTETSFWVGENRVAVACFAS